HKCNLLKAGVIIYAYNHHARLLPSEPSVVKQPKSTRIEGAGIVMKSSGFCYSSIARYSAQDESIWCRGQRMRIAATIDLTSPAPAPDISSQVWNGASKIHGQLNTFAAPQLAAFHRVYPNKKDSHPAARPLQGVGRDSIRAEAVIMK